MSAQWASFIGVLLGALGSALLLIEWAMSFWGSVNTEAARDRIAGKNFLSDGKPLADFKVVRGRILRKALPRVSLYGLGLFFFAAGFGFQAYGSYPWALDPNSAGVPAGQFWPDLTDGLGKLGPLFISAAVAVVAYWQWQTSNAKFVLELRNERIQIYKAIRSVVGGAIVAQANPSNSVVMEFEDAIGEVKAWFGNDVVIYIEELRIAINNYHATWAVYKATDSQENAKSEARSREIVVDLWKDLEDKFMPYIRLAQKIH